MLSIYGHYEHSMYISHIHVWICNMMCSPNTGLFLCQITDKECYIYLIV